MGNFFSKRVKSEIKETKETKETSEKPFAKRVKNEETQVKPQLYNEEEEEMKKIINQYEYIKNQKRITNLDVIVGVMKNTDWDKIEVKPSAPPLPITYTHLSIPIAIAEPVITITNENVPIAKMI